MRSEKDRAIIYYNKVISCKEEIDNENAQRCEDR